MSDDSGLWLLLAGPASAVGLYWLLYRFYRNTDKSHNFEHETAVDAKPFTASDTKVDKVTGTRESRIRGGFIRRGQLCSQGRGWNGNLWGSLTTFET